MNNRVAKRFRREVNAMFGNVTSAEAKRVYRQLKKAYKTTKTVKQTKSAEEVK